jgi:hypothetical protein
MTLISVKGIEADEIHAGCALRREGAPCFFPGRGENRMGWLTRVPAFAIVSD